MSRLRAFQTLCAIVITIFGTFAALAQDSAGSGTITVAGQTIGFKIDICNKFSGGEESSFTMGGTAQMPGGGISMIQVNVANKTETTEHAVTLFQMGTQYIAHAKKIEGQEWKNSKGDPAGPIVTIEGKSISVSGEFFRSAYPPESVGTGTLTATCGQVMTMDIQ